MRGAFFVVRIVDLPARLPDLTATTILLDEFGLEPAGNPLTEVERQIAAAIIADVLAYHLAYRAPTKIADIAEQCAHDFVALFPSDTKFYTNSDRPLFESGLGGWDPLTSCTFDTGVLAISDVRCGVLWCGDDD